MHGRRVLGVAGFALVAATVSAVLASAGSSPDSHQATASTAGQSGLERAFNVLSRTPAQANGAPNAFESSAGRLMHVDAAAASPLNLKGNNVWAASNASSDLCVAAVSASEVSGGCGHPSAVEADGLFTQSHPAPDDIKSQGLAPGTVDVVALVPDGAQSVEFTFADGTSRAADVADNGVTARFDHQPQRARFTDAVGNAHVVELAVK
jgi:hypothetical protein